MCGSCLHEPIGDQRLCHDSEESRRQLSCLAESCWNRFQTPGRYLGLATARKMHYRSPATWQDCNHPSKRGRRWFFEPLRYGDHLPAPSDALPETVWIENKGRTLEEVCQAATKEAAKTGMGLKWGLRQVDVRQRRASGNATIKQVLKKKAGAGFVMQPASTKPHCEAPDACSLALSNFESNANASCGQVDKSTHQLPASRRTVVSRTHVVTTSGDSPSQFDGTVEHRKSSEDSQPSQPFVWTCNLCQASSRQSSMRKLTEWRSNHIAYVHKAERPRVNKIKSTLTVIEATKLPWHLTSWVCSQCEKGLPSCDSRDQLRKSARAHLQTHSKKDQKCLTLKTSGKGFVRSIIPKLSNTPLLGSARATKPHAAVLITNVEK